MEAAGACGDSRERPDMLEGIISDQGVHRMDENRHLNGQQDSEVVTIQNPLGSNDSNRERDDNEEDKQQQQQHHHHHRFRRHDESQHQENSSRELFVFIKACLHGMVDLCTAIVILILFLTLHAIYDFVSTLIQIVVSTWRSVRYGSQHEQRRRGRRHRGDQGQHQLQDFHDHSTGSGWRWSRRRRWGTSGNGVAQDATENSTRDYTDGVDWFEDWDTIRRLSAVNAPDVTEKEIQDIAAIKEKMATSENFCYFVPGTRNNENESVSEGTPTEKEGNGAYLKNVFDHQCCYRADSCPICLLEWNDTASAATNSDIQDDVGRLIVVSKKCRHAFHEECVAQWLQKNQSCPCCRTCLWGDEQVKISNGSS